MLCFYLLAAFAVGDIFYLLQSKSVISLTMTDLAVFLFLFYSLLHISIFQGFRCDPIVGYKWSAAALCYLFFRKLKKPHIVLYGIMLYGLFQSVVAIGQSLSIFQSVHRFFSVTGTIGNPGPLGGFLAIAAVCSTALMWQTIKEKQFRLVLINGLATCILLAGLLLTDSRAAFLSLSIGLVAIWGNQIRKLFDKYKPTAFLTFTVITTLLCCFLYLRRTASADARLLIWRVSANMIADKPVFGHGIGAFDREYMLYQAAYFEQNPQSSLLVVADNTAYPYNEWLHVGIELGMVGFCLLLVVFVTVFAFSSSDTVNRSLKAGLISFIIFSLFSYPAEIIELFILPSILLGSLREKTLYIFSIHSWIKVVAVISLTGIIFLSFAGILISQKISNEIKLLAASDTQIQTPYCDRYFSVLMYNADFNMTYLSILCQLPCQPDNWQKIIHIFPSSETYCHLGEACECYGQYGQAERLYRKAADMVPARILPNYHLWKLYVKHNDDNHARAMAQKIISQPLKVENTFTLQVKGQMKQYLIQTK